mgnify:CR=1 FL=1
MWIADKTPKKLRLGSFGSRRPSFYLLIILPLPNLRQNSLDSHSEINAARKTLAAKQLSAIEDVDLAEAISKMAQQTAAVQAAQQGFAKMQQLSLFNYL